MKVLCLFNNILELENKQIIGRLKKYIHLSDGQLNLKLNYEYIVHGILFRDNSPWYYLYLDEDDESPTPFPAELFKVQDEKLSVYWQLSVVINEDGSIASSLVFEEWAKDPLFFERLIDEDPTVLKVFDKYRAMTIQEATVK